MNTTHKLIIAVAAFAGLALCLSTASLIVAGRANARTATPTVETDGFRNRMKSMESLEIKRLP